MTSGHPDAHPCRDEESFLAFYNSTSRGLWSYLYYLCHDRAWADDLTQETYLRFLQAAARVAPGPGLAGYLYKIGSNLFVDQCRRKRVEFRWAPVSHSKDDFTEPSGAAQRAASNGLEARADASTIMRKMKKRDRLLLWLAYGEGVPHQEIAKQLGLGVRSVKVLLLRARRRLADMVGGA